MRQCPTCSQELDRLTPFCPACGSSLQSDDNERTILTNAPNAMSPGSPRYASIASSAAWVQSQSSEDSGFASGSVVGGRFRIIGLLGRGGMGEVYRADDLLLEQAVALKFLPRNLAENPDRQARFYGEVRIARQVSHPSVCRVYDVGVIDGVPYLSMELVEGDDLGSLLRRIGRLPEDKALDVARQLCAGLAAAHERGVLHRDLKPANIMIDAQGKVRITDFGLAVLVEHTGPQEKRAGTPAYMAPEQLTSNTVSIRSDVYSLGLVLYEIFTGRRAFRADSVLEVERLQREKMPADPSSILEDLDPVIERAILRCLDKDPAVRPESALAVAASLPGGDPLAAALAAGEMPSPEIVAAAGGAGGLRRGVAWGVLAGALAGMGLLLAVSGQRYLVNRVPLHKPPAVLEDRAVQIVADLGYVDAPGDHARGFTTDVDYIDWVRHHQHGAQRWDGLAVPRTAAISFWYRRSPERMAPLTTETGGAVSLSDPPLLHSGMLSVVLDPAGRLRRLEAVPAQIDSSATAASEPDWTRAFTAAGLDAKLFSTAEPQWVPQAFADRRAAWVGEDPELPGVPLRVEAGAYRGRISSFQIVAPWTRAERMTKRPLTAQQRGAQTFVGVLLFLLILGAAALARRSVKRGHGDYRGATRIALILLVLNLISWVLSAHHTSSPNDEWSLFVPCLGVILFISTLVWLLYVGLEPYVRRHWPDSLIGWNRVLAGRLRDPRVGRDLLLGMAAGVLMLVVFLLKDLIAARMGEPSLPETTLIAPLQSTSGILAMLCDLQTGVIFEPMVMLFMVVSLRMLVRRPAVAPVLIWLIFSFLAGSGGESAGVVTYVASAIGMGILVTVLLRLGLFAAIGTNLVLATLVAYFPLTTDFSAWYAPAATVGLVYLVALLVYAFAASTGRLLHVRRAIIPG